MAEPPAFAAVEAVWVSSTGGQGTGRCRGRQRAAWTGPRGPGRGCGRGRGPRSRGDQRLPPHWPGKWGTTWDAGECGRWRTRVPATRRLGALGGPQTGRSRSSLAVKVTRKSTPMTSHACLHQQNREAASSLPYPHPTPGTEVTGRAPCCCARPRSPARAGQRWPSGGQGGSPSKRGRSQMSPHAQRPPQACPSSPCSLEGMG